jgi:hypothetical protein
LKEINPDYLIAGHCTGDRFYDLARNELGDKVIRLVEARGKVEIADGDGDMVDHR